MYHANTKSRGQVSDEMRSYRTRNSRQFVNSSATEANNDDISKDCSRYRR